MHSFPNLETVCCSMYSSNSCLLTCIQISQEAGQVVWYSHVLQNFSLILVIHTVKGFGIVNKAKVDVFRKFSHLFDDPVDVYNLISGSSGFLNTAWTTGSSWFTYCWNLAWRILNITLVACAMSTIVWSFEHSLALPFFGIGMKTDLFQSCGHCWDGETVETVSDFIFGGSKITADGGCSHEIKRRLLLGRKVMTNLDYPIYIHTHTHSCCLSLSCV